MKTYFKFYGFIWTSLLAIYNLVVFLVKPLTGFSIHYDLRFWLSWGVIIAAFIGLLVCAGIAFYSKNKEKLFLNIPLIAGSYAALIVTTIAGSVLMLIPDCPAWIAAIVCAAVFGFSAISVIKAKVAADIVGETDDKIKAKTFFIKTLTIDAESLISRAQSEAVKAECKKIYEAVRFSDPMSNALLSSVEGEIIIKFAKLSDAVSADDLDTVSEIANEIIILLGDRNKKCKLLK